ncbi:hypothetical protein F4802DRAFT_123846 [Xylaria palmicola]|nr:hypothetical protein F4802DRAFT_123846 [Xylaria palmicola]
MSDAYPDRELNVVRAICPWKDCVGHFRTRKGLLRHFEIHIPCQEWCLLCGKYLTTASTFIRHSRNHTKNEIEATKRCYIISTCDALHNQAEAELKRLECLYANSPNTTSTNITQKRALDEEFLQLSQKRSRQFPDILDSTPISATDKQSQQSTDQASLEWSPPIPAPESADMFAPSLFFDAASIPANLFDAPMFEPIYLSQNYNTNDSYSIQHHVRDIASDWINEEV